MIGKLILVVDPFQALGHMAQWYTKASSKGVR
jgi:hypothetical protein